MSRLPGESVNDEQMISSGLDSLAGYTSQLWRSMDPLTDQRIHLENSH